MKKIFLCLIFSSALVLSAKGQIFYDSLTLSPIELDTLTSLPIAYPKDSTFFLVLISVNVIFDYDTIENTSPDICWISCGGIAVSDSFRPYSAQTEDGIQYINTQPPPYFDYHTNVHSQPINLLGAPLMLSAFMNTGRHGMGGAKIYLTYVSFKL